MLSYQHIYHAGNLADVHKHALLAVVLDYLTRKEKPLTYIETHAGRGLYDLSAAEARKTGEAAAGVARLEAAFDPAHPYARVLAATRAAHGPSAYPGSPAIAAHLLRTGDSLHLAERHPGEATALDRALAGSGAKIRREDGFEMAHGLTPPTPRRGLMLIDPSYEVKADYEAIPRHIAKLARAWNVGMILLWYPILQDARHRAMIGRLRNAHPEALCHEVGFAPARPGHGMRGSGLFVLRPSFGLVEETARLDRIFAALDSTE